MMQRVAGKELRQLRKTDLGKKKKKTGQKIGGVMKTITTPMTTTPIGTTTAGKNMERSSFYGNKKITPKRYKNKEQESFHRQVRHKPRPCLRQGCGRKLQQPNDTNH